MRSFTRFIALAVLLLTGLTVWTRDNQRLEAGGAFAFAKPGDGAWSYLRTSRSDFAKESFQTEVTVKFPAAVTVFAEPGSQSHQPLGAVGFLKWPKVEVKAGEAKTVQITPEGQIE